MHQSGSIAIYDLKIIIMRHRLHRTIIIIIIIMMRDDRFDALAHAATQYVHMSHKFPDLSNFYFLQFNIIKRGCASAHPLYMRAIHI